MTVSNIPSDWVAPVNHALTTTGTGTGHAILANAANCGVADAFGDSLDTYDVCDDQGFGYDADDNSYSIILRASLDSHADSGETFTVTLTDSSTPPNTVSFTMTINDPPPEISVSLPISEGESRSDAGEKKVPENEGATGIGFDLSADQPLSSALTVCVRVTESGGDRVASGSEGIQTVNMPSSGLTNGSGTHTLTWTDTAADDRDSSVTVEVVAPYTASCSATNGSYTVSSSEGSDKLLIQDDEDTTVSLTSTDPTMTEGDASDTAVLTISLDRRLYAGETIGVPIALATTTGARLPGSTDSGTANHDFTVAAAAASMHSGVSLVNALTANPRVVFTGHDTNTVQTATVTLTPVANRDDGDAAHETITATLTQLGLLDTTVSGVTAHATNNAATLSLEDDEAAPPATTCSAQNNVFSNNRLRILETGETTYCVRLTTAPSGGNTTVTIHRDAHTGFGSQNAATVSPTTLTFTASNYQTPQQVTVTGADEPGSHRNRSLRLRHTASGGGYSGTLANAGSRPRVNVDDAPELEAWDTAVWQYTVIDEGDLDNPDPSKRRARTIQVNADPVQRPSTIKATRGFRFFRQDFAPGPSGLWYRLRLSNPPEPGGTVSVTAASSDFTRFGLSLTQYGTPRASLTVTFTESGELDRRIWVINRQMPAPSKGCADISHTASGGGLRPGRIGTIRAHSVSDNGSSCPRITGTPAAGDSRSAPATAAPAPTEAVANVQVTAVDDTSASVTWDAVEHATSYDVSWSAESSDALTASAGDLPGVTGTTAAIDHGAPVAMTLTVTVTPEYVDKNGDTQQLASLAGTATLAVGPGSDALSASAESTDSQTPACVSDALLADVDDRIANAGSTAGTERWTQVKNALTGQANAIALTEVKTIYDRRTQNGWSTSQWDPVIEAMECLENKPAEAQAEAQQAVPAITVTAGAGVTEGTAAGFTLKADPAPAEELAVTVALAADRRHRRRLGAGRAHCDDPGREGRGGLHGGDAGRRDRRAGGRCGGDGVGRRRLCGGRPGQERQRGRGGRRCHRSGADSAGGRPARGVGLQDADADVGARAGRGREPRSAAGVCRHGDAGCRLYACRAGDDARGRDICQPCGNRSQEPADGDLRRRRGDASRRRWRRWCWRRWPTAWPRASGRR